MSTSGHTKAGVSAGHEETARAASEVLEAGGNAFDAAIAGFLTACVAEPVLASLGGGGFMMARPASQAARVFDFFTQTPHESADPNSVDFQAITADFGTATQEFHIGLGSVASPGAIAGIFKVHHALGRMPMSEIAAPAIGLARAGVTVNAFQAYLLTVVEPIYTATTEARVQFCRGANDGETPAILEQGDIHSAPDFADFLDTLSREGPDFFYKGEIADRIAALSGCTINKADLAAYEVVNRDPIVSTVNGSDVSINPPPAIGGALITLALSMLEKLDLGDADFGSDDHLRALVSVMSACNQARAGSEIDLNPLEGAEMLKKIAAYPPAYRGTTHISVADADGNVAAMTVSNGEGCGAIIPGTGVMLNNMLGEEDLNVAGFFNWPCNRRMSSMMSPGIMVSPSGAVTGFGSGGSNRIRSAITQFLANMAMFDMDIETAVRSPRLHLEGDKLDIEPGFSEGGLNALKGDYPTAKVWPDQSMYFGGVHAIRIDHDGSVTGAADLRRGGVFIGV